MFSGSKIIQFFEQLKKKSEDFGRCLVVPRNVNTLEKKFEKFEPINASV